MTIQPSIDRITNHFFGLKSIGALRSFLSELDPSDPFQSALLRYAASWPASNSADADASFNPRGHLSEDLSAVMFGECPCIFLGTNNWAIHGALASDDLRQKTRSFANHVRCMRDRYADRPIVLIIVPEKDYLIDSIFRTSRSYDGMRIAMDELDDLMQELSISLLFGQPMIGMENYQLLADFSYPDTHLPARNYIQIYASVVQAFHYEWQKVEPRIRLAMHEDYFDLPDKLDGMQPNPQSVMGPLVEDADVSLIAGFEDFQNPLGETWQRLRNATPVFNSKVLLLGDSHSSIYSRRKLNHLFASTFAETEFHWNPCGVRGASPDTDADHIIFEISQRFIF